ncbi:winged helix-turn-helix transcriptional regulator [Neptunicella marina]|uniref:Helix-turn-helix transcriptional regulator n=1 Tax=Neptunicella marina TaxID=2125989 RepID=A0A8J6IQQ0_9ALTE|nr:helix-turn-helix domain-containing protein [Neptunicella marina]MBC3765151.1 helix-turn-helix transcriptional regulator [Neptunicella marina]
MQQRPIMQILELFSKKWILRLLWELQDDMRGFREMRRICDDIPPTTLSKRLKELEQAGLIFKNEQDKWQISELGKSLEPTLMKLNQWANDWASDRK